MKFLAFFALFLALPALASPGLDVNDVAILFPLNEAADALYPNIDLEGLVQDSTFKEVFTFSQDHQGAMNGSDYKDWRIVALRYDPCAAVKEPNMESCHPQIRLVAQPLQTTGGMGLADMAMHLLYRVGDKKPSSGDEVIAGLQDMQTVSRQEGFETVGLALNVHPGLRGEMKSRQNAVAKLMQSFIKTYCRKSHLEEITFTASANGGSQWNFFHGPVHNLKWTPDLIENLPGKELIQSTDINGGFFPVFKKTSTGLGQIANTNIHRTPRLTNGLLLQTENPLRSNFKNVDCASCHVSSKIMAHDFEPNYSNSKSFTNPIGVTGFAELALQPQQFNDNVRNFGYSADQPTVSTLTANSAANVSDIVNRSQNWENPARVDCSAPEIRSCFRKGRPAADCISLCRPMN